MKIKMWNGKEVEFHYQCFGSFNKLNEHNCAIIGCDEHFWESRNEKNECKKEKEKTQQ